MNNKKIVILLMIIIIILIGIICNFISGNIIKEKQIIKEMSETTQVSNLQTQINTLNISHEEYTQNVQTSKAKVAAAITEMGVETSEQASADTMASNIKSILNNAADGSTFVSGTDYARVKHDVGLAVTNKAVNSYSSVIASDFIINGSLSLKSAVSDLTPTDVTFSGFPTGVTANITGNRSGKVVVISINGWEYSSAVSGGTILTLGVCSAKPKETTYFPIIRGSGRAPCIGYITTTGAMCCQVLGDSYLANDVLMGQCTFITN